MNLQQVVRGQCPDVPERLVEMHFRRLSQSYFERYAAGDIARHLRLLAEVNEAKSVRVDIRPLAGPGYEVTVVGIDHSGTVACITAALAASGLELQDLHVASYFSTAAEALRAREPDLFVVSLRVTADLAGHGLAEFAAAIEERLHVAFAHLAAGNLLEAQTVAADSQFSRTQAPFQTPTRLDAQAARADFTGLILGGDFRLDKQLAVGGMSEVYLAQQTSLNRTVAVKLVRHECAPDDDLLARFYQEGLVLGQFSCPQIVQVYAAGTIPGRSGGRLGWMAMEYMAGGDLARWQKQHGTLAADLATRWLRHSLEGLAYAHRRGILHRDLKPHNLLLTADGHLKVSDFGLLKQLESQPRGLTPRQAVIGTPHYMSPEQALGEPLDERSDIFSLGTTFFHLLSGRLPFEKHSATAVLVQISHEDSPPLLSVAADTPVPLAVIVDRMMARARERRYQDVDVILDDLASYERRGLLREADNAAFAPPAAATPPGNPEQPTRAYEPPTIDDVVI